jgi:hypothetical protein
MAGKKPLKFRPFLFTDEFDKDVDKVIRGNAHDLTRLNDFMGALVAHSETSAGRLAGFHCHARDRQKPGAHAPQNTACSPRSCTLDPRSSAA